ncbi:MAG: hypothetical protein U9N45_00345 [Gemmatimonadota bacterium]|nr:hypothetical protein [Gemmatimonadota bacterium]
MADNSHNNDFSGYHSEWNLGSPGGWYYQLLAQQLGRFIWDRIRRVTGLSLALDFDHPILSAPPGLRDMLLSAHSCRWGRSEAPGIAILAEEDTLDVVVENRLMVEYLCKEPGVKAVLAAPAELEKTPGGEYRISDTRITVAFCDFNNAIVAQLADEHKAGALLDAVSDNITVNPRGMEPVGSKGIFEAVTGPLGKSLSAETVRRTPWTRRFYPRKTEGPDGARIADLVEWTRNNWKSLVLKPEHGFSGKGVFVGYSLDDADKCIQTALDHGEYIVQQMIPVALWSEKYPEAGTDRGNPVLRVRQTDFRCLISDNGLFGILSRYGGIPTNVGSGGGTQSVAVIDGSAGDAAALVCDAMEKMPGTEFDELSEEVGRRALSLGLGYLDGPIPQAMRPRIISLGQLTALKRFSRGLWQDCVKLEKCWREGNLDRFLTLPEKEKSIASRQAWNGSPALLASDGLYSFGADLVDG